MSAFTTSNKPRSRLPRLRKMPSGIESNQNGFHSNTSTNGPSSVQSVSTSTVLTRNRAIQTSKIPRLRATTLLRAFDQNKTLRILATDCLVENSSPQGPATTNSTGNSPFNVDVPAMTSEENSSTVESIAIENTSDSALHPVTPMDEHNMVIANDVNLFAEALFKSFDEFEENQRKRFQEFSPVCSATPRDVCIFDEPLSSSLELELRQLKDQVILLEMEKADLLKQLELANQHCSVLQHQIVSFECKQIQPSKCQDPILACAVALEDTQPNVVNDQVVALQRISKQFRRLIDELNDHTEEIDVNNAAVKPSKDYAS
ncbi:hypothetical protein AC1031_001566 [Aphanomyces cochlioides]|nr:hypothetical protein AC1031_001566 [Aphanomyces cochlioides]